MKGKVGAAVPFMSQFDDLVGRNDIVDHAVVNLAYASGAKASLLLCFFAPNNGLPFGVLGSMGRMEANVNRQLEGFILHENSKTFDYPQGSRGEFIAARENQVGEGFIVHPGGLRQHMSFYEAVRKNKPVFCTAEIGRQSVAVALAAERSIALNGTPVDAETFLKVENIAGAKSTRRRKSRA